MTSVTSYWFPSPINNNTNNPNNNDPNRQDELRSATSPIASTMIPMIAGGPSAPSKTTKRSAASRVEATAVESRENMV